MANLEDVNAALSGSSITMVSKVANQVTFDVRGRRFTFDVRGRRITCTEADLLAADDVVAFVEALAHAEDVASDPTNYCQTCKEPS